MDNKGLFQRMLWSSFYIILLSYTIYMVTNLWSRFLSHPTVTSLVSSTYPVSKIPFPSVAVCGVNKISKRRARDLTAHIANVTHHKPEEIMSYIRFLGQLYDFDFEASTTSQLLEFQKMLDLLKMTVMEVTKRIATPCEELLKKCWWHNIEVNCSDIFYTRLTYQGYCCVFNYFKEAEDWQEKREVLAANAGVENGLYFSLNNIVWDYYYTTLSSPGIMIDIFVHSDYPDKASGGVTEILTTPNSENFIEIVPTTVVSVDDVSYYSKEKRECVLDYEEKTVFKGAYSQSDCKVDCRVTSIQAMCQCIPFMIPFSTNSTVCTLSDIPCLNRYRDKWSSFYPDFDYGPYLKREKQDSLRCEKICYSSCNEISYRALVTSFPIFNKTENKKNITHVYVYYSNRFSQLYKQDVLYYWFEILSNFGGIFGIFVGWSLISIIQLLTHYLKKIYEKIRT